MIDDYLLPEQRDELNLKNLTEKYCPKNVDSIFGQPNVKNLLKAWIVNRKFPHLLLIGPPGVGKTSTATALGHELLGDEYKTYFRDFSAPDYSRQEDMAFIRAAGGAVVRGGLLRIIFLDDCDYLTRLAQGSLLSILEKNTGLNKYILACNNIGSLVDPLVNRCTKIYFRPVRADAIAALVEKICVLEDIGYEKGVPELIGKNANESMRAGITFIDRYKGASGIPNYISLQSIIDDVGAPDNVKIEDLLMNAISSNFQKCDEQLDTLRYVNSMEARDILREAITVIDKLNVDKEAKKFIAEQVSLYDWRVHQNVDTEVQMKCFLRSLGGIKVSDDWL